MSKSILVISDLHCPHEHKNTVDFLKEIKIKYNPDLVISIGDEIDGHTISYHDKDPDGLWSPGQELNQAIKSIGQIQAIFEEVLVCDSNHGSLVFRKLLSSGLPRIIAKDWKDVLRAPKWRWANAWIIDGILFHHGASAAYKKLSMHHGLNTVEGHHHTEQGVVYWQGMGCNNARWSAKTGCMIDNNSYAFRYNKLNLRNVLLGHILILDGSPRVLHMGVTHSGEWDGVVP